jgi:hypothetical protein
VALYAAAVEEDKACEPSSKVAQCQLRVIPALCVSSCAATTYVNTRAGSTAARLRWDKVPCPVPTNCGATDCRPLPTAAQCIPTADGGGRCADVIP